MVEVRNETGLNLQRGPLFIPGARPFTPPLVHMSAHVHQQLGANT